jgi:Ca2+-binding RTX toxin-like protein
MALRGKGSLGCAALLVFFAATAASGPQPSMAQSCAEGPQTVGNMIVGTPCADTIRAPRGVTTVNGEGGDDTIYGQRGNDQISGGEGNDRLYGGIGDDRPRGGPGDDFLSGGFGADSLDGEGGNDFVRGDATIDAIADTGGGADTLSYATGATPGFFDGRPGVSDFEGLPPDREGRGAYVNLQSGLGDNGLAPSGGGVDEGLEGTSFEIVIGTAFTDFIVGTADAETIYGGGGADVILGEGGADVAFGGADGDSCDAATVFECETDEEEVEPRDPSAISVGLMAPQSGANPAPYLTGSDEDDIVTASYAAGVVTFTLGPDSEGTFDTTPTAAGGCAAPAGGKVTCPTPSPPDSVVLAGLDGNDTLAVSGFGAGATEATSVILLGNGGNDKLSSGITEDALVDGAGEDTADAGGRDDAVPNNQGGDQLHAGPGEDLFVSNAVCDGDRLDGGPDRDNANWANFSAAVAIEMEARRAGLVGSGGQPQCASPELLTVLEAVEDTEGTSFGDVMVGDAGPNQLLGRPGPDSYFAAAGDDSILANSGTPNDDPDPTIDCGEGFDTAQIDHPENGPDAAPVGCESVQERDPNSFRPPDTPPDPDPEPPVTETPSTQAPPPPPPRPKPPAADRTPPRTGIVHRPHKHALTTARYRRVVFAFASNEAGGSFLCGIDRRRPQPCRSPRPYRLQLGAHTFRVFAVDQAGNRDRSPARFAFSIRRR